MVQISSLCHCVHHKPNVDRCRIKPALRGKLFRPIKINPVALQPYRALADRAAAAG